MSSTIICNVEEATKFLAMRRISRYNGSDFVLEAKYKECYRYKDGKRDAFHFSSAERTILIWHRRRRCYKMAEERA